MLPAFADVQSRTDKAQKTQAKANNQEGEAAVRKLWVKTLIQVEQDCEDSWTEKKKLHKDNQRALTRIRQQVKKMTAGDYKVKGGRSRERG